MFSRNKKMSVFTLLMNCLPIFPGRHTFVLVEELAHGIFVRKARGLCNFF